MAFPSNPTLGQTYVSANGTVFKCTDPVSGIWTAQSNTTSAATITNPISLSDAAGQAKRISFDTGPNTRWTVQSNAQAETSGNVGSNFEIVRYDDGGAAIDSPLTINRATGVATFSSVTTPALTATAANVVNVVASQTVTTNAVISSVSTLGAATAATITANDAAFATLKVNGTDIVSEPGVIFYTTQNIAPAGSLKANGAVVSRTTYANLFAKIGTAYGVGNGSTTFQLPDLRGMFVRGWSDGSTLDAGRAIGSIQQDAFQGHKHAIGTETYLSAAGGVSVQGIGNTTALTGVPTSDGTNGTPRIASETRPVNIALLACIKY